MKHKKKRVLSILLLIVLIIFVPGISGGANDLPPENNLEAAELPSVASLFFKIMVSLLVILILTFLILKLIKKQQNYQQNQKEWIQIMDYQALGQNRGIYLLNIFTIPYIVGVTDGQINILKELDPQDQEWQEVKGKLERSSEIISPGIQKFLQQGWKSIRYSGQARQPEKDVLTQDFNDQLQQQLKRTHHLLNRAKEGEDHGK